MASEYLRRINDSSSDDTNIVDYHDPKIQLLSSSSSESIKRQQILSTLSTEIDDTEIQSTTTTPTTITTKSLNSILLKRNFLVVENIFNDNNDVYYNVNISTATNNSDDDNNNNALVVNIINNNNNSIDNNNEFNDSNSDFQMKKFFVQQQQQQCNDDENSPRAIMATTKKLLTVSTFPSSSSSSSSTTTMKTNCQTELEFQPPKITSSSLMMMMMINNVWPKWSSSSSSTLQSINYGNYRIVMSIIFILQILFINHHIDSCSCLPTSSLPKSSSTSSLTDNQMMINDDDINYPIITNNKLATIRFVRSYSEEFMSSSEERERGLQFFGGTSAGSSVALSSSTTALLSSSSQSSSSSAQKRISPYFDTESISTNVTISEGSAFVHLPCRVKQLGDRTLSWIRRQDFQILTVGTFTYTSDQQFQAIHRENSDDWSLQISYPRKKDAGIYECQISTMPKMSLFIQLNVVVSRAKIVEGPTLYLSSGSTLNLTCMVKDTPEPPDYIFWYYNGQVINYGSPRGIKVHTEKSAQTISKLIILKAQANDSGNYSCTPSNAEPAHIAVHIQNNANPAASIQHGKRSASREYNNGNGCQQLYRSSFILTILTSLIMALFL